MKVLICVIASFNEPHFKDLITLRKKQLQKYSIPHVFLYDEPFPTEYVKDESDILIPRLNPLTQAYNPTLNPFMVQRFIQMKQYIQTELYDYIIRVNISTYVNFNKLKEILPSFPKERFLAGHLHTFYVAGIHDEDQSSFTFCSGTSMIMSTDIYNSLCSYSIHDPQFYKSNDDVVISYYAKENHASLYHIPMQHVETDAMPNVKNNDLVYRIKHYLHREKEVNHWKYLLSVYDSICADH